MKKSTLGVLVVLVGVLTFFYVREDKGRAAGLTPVQHPLFFGFAPNRVSAIRVDNVERSVQLKLERDAAGSWFMTDPIAYPAIDSLVRTLLQTLSNSLGELDIRVDPAEVRLEPPLVVMEIEQAASETMDELSFRLEIGAVDLDASKIYVRVPDHPAAPDGSDAAVFRTVRTIYNTLDRNPDDFRETRATHLLGRQVTSFRRRGRAFVPELGHEVDLELDALLEPTGWKQVNPPVVTLDPTAIQLLARGAAELKSFRFAADFPSSLEPWGLSPPAFTIELLDERGAATRLHFGQPQRIGPGIEDAAAWYCQREGFPHVWEVSTRDVYLLIRPAEDLYDYRIVRSRREDVQSVELEAGGRTLVLEREDPEGEDWNVGVLDSDLRYPADPGAVEDVLAALENVQLGDYLAEGAFIPEEEPMSVTIVTRDMVGNPVRWGGRIGKPARDAGSGSTGRLFLRWGDELSGWIPEEIAALCLGELDDLRSRTVHTIRPEELIWIKLTTRGSELTYARAGDGGRWVSYPNEIPAPDGFTLSVDPMLALRATRWLPEGDPGDLVERLSVVARHNAGHQWSFTLGRTEAGETLCFEGDLVAEIDPRVGGLNDRNLVDVLLELFGE